jgi:hypothetical protein
MQVGIPLETTNLSFSAVSEYETRTKDSYPDIHPDGPQLGQTSVPTRLQFPENTQQLLINKYYFYMISLSVIGRHFSSF